MVSSSDLVEALDYQALQVRGLRQGKYVLLIDGQQIGRVESGQLEAGINLATLDTPMLEQARLVAYDTERKNSLEAAGFQILQVSTDKDNLNTAGALRAALPLAETRQRIDAQPRSHRFVIRLVGKKQLTGLWV